MKGLDVPVLEHKQEQGFSDHYKVDFQAIQAWRQSPPPPGPYDFMNPCDRWMIGKPADAACMEYYDSIGARRVVAVKFLLVGGLLNPTTALPLAIGKLVEAVGIIGALL